jgi:predicted aconitase
VTIISSPPDRPLVDETQLLFKEARQRRRRRWLAAGIATVAAATVLIIVGVTPDPQSAM